MKTKYSHGQTTTKTTDRWTNRRRMAWLALFAGLLFPALVLISESNQLGEIAGAFYIFVGAVVGAYIGFATVDDKWHKPLSEPEREYTDPEERFK